MSINLDQWVADHRELLKPPVGNAQVWEETDDFIIFVVGGPNARTDFHDDPFEEFFYQLKGDMVLQVIENGAVKDVPICEGEIFLLPVHVRHSPQRPDPDSIGLVIERKRPSDAIDGFEWFCPKCQNLLYRVEVNVKDIVADLPPLFDKFYGNAERRTCRNCWTIHPAI